MSTFRPLKDGLNSWAVERGCVPVCHRCARCPTGEEVGQETAWCPGELKYPEQQIHADDDGRIHPKPFAGEYRVKPVDNRGRARVHDARPDSERVTGRWKIDRPDVEATCVQPAARIRPARCSSTTTRSMSATGGTTPRSMKAR